MSDMIKSFLPFKNKRRGTADTISEEVPTKVDQSRSRSLGDIGENEKELFDIETTSPDEWKELSLLKSLAPVVVCVLPSVARDFVASVLLAIGANPVMPEEAEDVERHLGDCKAVLVDITAKKDIIEAVVDNYVIGSVPLILVCWEAGTIDARKHLARMVIERCSPSLISGRLGDVHALTIDVMDHVKGELDDTEEDAPATSVGGKTVVRSLPAKLSPRFKKKNLNYARQNTAIPQMVLKGQFRHHTIKDVSVPLALDSARKLAAQYATYVHVYEVNVVTCGEFFIEVNNSQQGMENVHSTIHCAAAIITAVIACIEEKGDETQLSHIGHALSLYHVAAEEAAILVSSKSEVISPGSLRVKFIDMLHKLDEQTVRDNAHMVMHNSPPSQ